MRISSLFIASLICISAASAEDLNEIFKKVLEYQSQGKIPQAINELKWAEKALEKENMKKIQTFFPDTLEGFSGEKLEANSALGFSNIERTYTKSGVDTSVKVSLTGTPQGSGLGSLAGIAQMAGMMNQGLDDETYRIGDMTAILHVDKEANSAEITVPLKSGSILKLEMNQGADGETLKKMVTAIDPAKLNTYFAG